MSGQDNRGFVKKPQKLSFVVLRRFFGCPLYLNIKSHEVILIPLNVACLTLFLSALPIVLGLPVKYIRKEQFRG
jgi:hypothetical protein